MSASKFDAMWDEAMSKYERIAKKKMQDLPRPRSTEDLIQEVQNANSQYESFRNKSSTIYSILSAVAKPIELVSDLAAGAASAAFPPSSIVFGAATHLVQAADGVSKILDAISDLMRELEGFSVRLNLYLKVDLSNELREKLTEILVTMIEILARSTKKIKEPYFRIKAYTKNVILANDTELQNLLGKLEKLTRSENFLVSAETYVEGKSTGKGVQALQTSMAAMEVSISQSSQGIADIKAGLNASRKSTREEKSLSQHEALKKILNPSATAHEKFEQIKRERRLVPRSGNWILEEEVFSDWVGRKKEPLLWITGTPGSGKSFLTYNIVTCLHGHFEDEVGLAPQDATVGFFFFQENSVATQSFRQALCDVAYQLTMRDPIYSRYLSTAGLSVADLSSVSLAWKVLFKDYWLSGRASNFAHIVLDGLDEGSTQERKVFIDLLKDVEDVGATSHLRVAMLGRSQIMEEMTLSDLREPPTIYVDSSKNGADIAHFVRSSITKSQSLKRVSVELQTKIIDTLTANAGGMFMWVKLMTAELNRKAQRGRESEVEKALNEAPKGLTELIEHVLEGFSISLSPDEADDLNTMLRWVALAQRPLCLGELDAALRLRSEDGAGLVYLEGMLRKTYASLFTLSREDDLTTADLFMHKQSADHEEFGDPEFSLTTGDGEEDLDYSAELDSNPKTTTVSFSHASISDYFLDSKHGKVTGLGDGASDIGVDLEAAQFDISEVCVNIIVDEAYRNRMNGAVSLLAYAFENWFEHLKCTEHELISEEARLLLGTKLVHMLHDEKHIQDWAGYRSATFFASDVASCLIPWVKDQSVLHQLDNHVAQWLDTVDKGKSVHEIFYYSIQCIAKQWMGIAGSTWSTKDCSIIISYWLARRKGGTIDRVPTTLAVNEIWAAARFGGFEETAEFHRRLAMTLRDFGHFEDAKKSFEKALELNPGMWLARGGIAKVHYLQEEYQRALGIYGVVISALEVHPEKGSTSVCSGFNIIFTEMADCYSRLRDQVNEYPSETALDLDVKACQLYTKAFQVEKSDSIIVRSCLRYWQMWANDSLLCRAKSKYTNPSEVPAKDQCFMEIMNLAHEMDSFQDELHSDALRHWLWDMADTGLEPLGYIAQAAKETGELEWLRKCYKEAISRARRALEPIAEAVMILSLGDLYHNFVEDGEKALRLWESLVSDRFPTINEQTTIMTIRREALGKLGKFCMRNALEDGRQSDRYISKLEEFYDRSRKGVSVILNDAVPPPLLAIYLGAWYNKLGRHEEAVKMVRPHVKDAYNLLSDDDPTNDWQGYLNLGFALIAVRDDRNMIALMHSFRNFRAGVAILSSDSQDDKGAANEVTDIATQMIDFCDASCGNELSNFDNSFTCRFDMLTTCSTCHARLRTAGRLPNFECSGSHEFLEVPPLTTRFKKGEIVVDGVVIDFAVWKQGIKEEWGV